MDIRPGTTLEGPAGQAITIQRAIGMGGLGQVFEGVLPTGKVVAVKTVRTSVLSEGELRALLNEIATAREIDHPNVVKVLHVNDGVGSPGTPPYLVMEFVTGGDLRTYLAQRQTSSTHFQVDELRALYQQLASGMNAISAKLVHRDLKPANILVDADGTLKITDFGLAKLAGATTRTETFKGWGTAAYMAPEAFEGTANTPAMDVYAVGIIFYELATLALPITPSPDNTLGWARAHLLQAPKDLRPTRPDLPNDLQQLIMQMLQKDPVRRPQDWADIMRRVQGRTTPPANAPDVSRLVERATKRFQEDTAAEAREMEARERQDERRAVLELAAREPLDLLRDVVQAFNAETVVGRLGYKEEGLIARVLPTAGTFQQLKLEIQIGSDIELPSGGIMRMLGSALLLPGPEPTREYDPNSFGGFNLAYRVPEATARYGTWRLYRFEMHPLVQLRSRTHWFALGLDILPKYIQLLNAMTEYQHEGRDLDDVWFKDLLIQLL